MSSFTEDYYKSTQDLEPSQLLIEALQLLSSPSKIALDLGCGAGRDTRLLLERGFKVIAVDSEPRVRKFIEKLHQFGDLTYVESTFASFDYKNYDLINAHYSLPFSPPESFGLVMDKILGSLNADGLFVGQFFGVNDEWNTPGSNMTFHTKTELQKLLSSVEIIKFDEKDADGPLTDNSEKHWHVFDVIARQK
jgi:tellurite methyltransferase